MNPSSEFISCSPIVTNINLVFLYIAERKHYPMIRTLPRKYSALTFVIDGSEHYYGDNIDITTTPGNILFIPKGTFYHIDSDTEFTHNICIDFDTTDPIESNPILYKTKNLEKFKKLFFDIEKYWRLYSHRSTIGIMYRFYGILNELQESLNFSYKPSWQVDRMLQAEQYIHQNYSNPQLCVEQIAGETKLSSRYFSEAFRKYYSVTPMRYVSELRIKHAKQLLDGGFHTVTEIACLCGFSDIYRFCKVFRKTTGMSPTEYVHSVLNE